MARVFVSYTAADKPFARRIAVALRAAGHDSWLDEDEILVGESIPAAVQRGLQGADFTVICLSKVAAARGWTEAERDAVLMQQLHDRKERILPVRLEDVAPPYLITGAALHCLPLALSRSCWPYRTTLIDCLRWGMAKTSARRHLRTRRRCQNRRPPSS